MAANGTPLAALTPKQKKAITCMLTCLTIKEAAKTAGVGERTLHRWLDLPAFRLALADAEGRAIEAAVRKLVGLSDGAVDTIQYIMTSPGMPPALSLRAAESILSSLLKLRELSTLEQRVTELEKARSKTR